MIDPKSIDEYFNQDEFYWSESNGNFLRLEDMPFQQAFYSHRKLLREHGVLAYGGTHLFQAFLRKLFPLSSEIRMQLARYGKACSTINEPGPLASKSAEHKVRSKMRGAMRTTGHKVSIHKVKTSVGSYLEATILVSGISVRGQSV